MMISGLATFEKSLFKILTRNADKLPPRWKRWLAIYYPDARVRKLFWQKTCVEMGEGTFANLGMIVVDEYSTGECLLSIGQRVSIAPGVVFAPYSMPNNSPSLLAHPYVARHLVQRAKIVVEDDVWIGAHCTILAGIKIGRAAIIGAGAVVNKDVPPYTVVAGVPARIIRQLEPVEPLRSAKCIDAAHKNGDHRT